MKWIRDTYKVPAKRGMRVIADGEYGRIVSASRGHLKIKLDERKRPGIYHPTWNMIYIRAESKRVFRGGVELRR
jgi:hypothetical protein